LKELTQSRANCTNGIGIHPVICDSNSLLTYHLVLDFSSISFPNKLYYVTKGKPVSDDIEGLWTISNLLKKGIQWM